MVRTHALGLGALTLSATFALGCVAPQAADQITGTQEAMALATNGLTAINGLTAANGLMAANGLTAVNGLMAANGLMTANGLTAVNGLIAANGLTAINGLTAANGLMTANGFTSADNAMLLKYMVRCALPSTQTISTYIDNTPYSFQGQLGLAPEWYGGACQTQCQEWVSACLMAFTNPTGRHRPIEMRSSNSAMGFGSHPTCTDGTVCSGGYGFQEASWYGNLFVSPPRGFSAPGSQYAEAGMWGRYCAVGGSTIGAQCPMVLQGNASQLNGQSTSPCDYAAPGNDPTKCYNTTVGDSNHVAYTRVITTYTPEFPRGNAGTGWNVNYSSAFNGNGEIFPQIEITNNTTSSVALSRVKVRYYFTNDGVGSNFSASIDGTDSGTAVSGGAVPANLQPANLHVAIGSMTPVTNADSYIEFTFDSGAPTLAPRQYAGLGVILTPNSGQTINSNDYSFNSGMASDLTNYKNITIFVDGNLVYGNVPH